MTTVEEAISVERLSPYCHVSGGDLDAAVQLYIWNAAISGAFWIDIAHLEIFVRNAMHMQLTQWSIKQHNEPRWYLDPAGILTPRRTTDIAIARARLTDGHRPKPETPGRVIAEIPLGFWRFLVSGHYELTLWRWCLHHGFAGQPRRRPLHDRLSRLHGLRNRIAHHEPIHRQPLAQHHNDLLTLVQWINPQLRNWIEAHSTVRSTLATRPVALHATSR
ncbi:MAG: hypothetical protein ACR2JX_01255 [Mycobacteriales bacterium]